MPKIYVLRSRSRLQEKNSRSRSHPKQAGSETLAPKAKLQECELKKEMFFMRTNSVGIIKLDI